MDITRRPLLLLQTAALAWQHVQAGTPEASSNYKLTDHWWGMLIDFPKCIGCGSRVRACAEENEVPDDYDRTWSARAVSGGGEEAEPARRTAARRPGKRRCRSANLRTEVLDGGVSHPADSKVLPAGAQESERDRQCAIHDRSDDGKA